MADDVTGVEVGTAYVTVLPSTKGFHKALAGDVNQASAAAGQSGGAAAGQGFAAGLGKFAPVIGGAVAGLLIGDKVKAFIGDSIGAASDLAESGSKVGVVFGQSAGVIEAWSQTSATAMIMSQQQALETAGTYGNLFTALGMTQGAAADLSTQAVQLGADLASFNNASPEDTLLAIRSALVGEFEPMRTYGSALSIVRVQQEALNAGLWDGKGKIDASAQAQATMNLILRDTKNAQGDVARTADGYANTMRAVDAAVQNAKATIGTEFLGVIQAVSKEMGGPTGFVGVIDRVAEKAANLAAGLGIVTTKLIELNNATANGDGETFLSRVWGSAVDATLRMTNSKWALEKLDEIGAASRAEAAQQQAVTDDAAGAMSRYVSQLYNAGQAAGVYAEGLRDAGDAAVFTSTGIGTLQAALEEFDAKAKARSAGSSVRDQWRALSGMGGSKSVDAMVPNPDWQPGSSVPRYVKKKKTVKTPFDPDVAGGRFAFTDSGDQARDWATALGQRVSDKAALFSDPEQSQAFIERWAKKLGGQFDDWGVRSPYKYAQSFLPTGAYGSEIATRNLGTRSSTRGEGDVYIMNGNITVGPNDDLKERLLQDAHQAKASRVPAGPRLMPWQR